MQKIYNANKWLGQSTFTLTFDEYDLLSSLGRDYNGVKLYVHLLMQAATWSYDDGSGFIYTDEQQAKNGIVPVRIPDLCYELGLGRSVVTRLLDQLEKHNLIQCHTGINSVWSRTTRYYQVTNFINKTTVSAE